jgi:post-segregation antitoxin (ccd killing protein)
MQTSPAQIDSPEKLQQYAKQHGLFIPENVMSNMQEHLASGQINYADLGQFVQKLSAEKNISTEEKNIFKQATLSAADVNSERTLMEYAKQLKIDIPEQTKALMVQDIRKQNTTPSKLANYLEGVSYERYLQSSDVPYLSEARHASIRQELGDNGYKKYTESVSSMAIKLGVTENAIDHLADKYLTDKVNGLQYINKSLPELNAPALHSESASIMQYSKHIGLPIDENKADILAENQLSKPQIKNMLIDDYFSQHAQSHEYRLSNQKTIEKRSDFELEM